MNAEPATNTNTHYQELIAVQEGVESFCRTITFQNLPEEIRMEVAMKGYSAFKEEQELLALGRAQINEGQKVQISEGQSTEPLMPAEVTQVMHTASYNRSMKTDHIQYDTVQDLVRKLNESIRGSFEESKKMGSTIYDIHFATFPPDAGLNYVPLEDHANNVVMVRYTSCKLLSEKQEPFVNPS